MIFVLPYRRLLLLTEGLLGVFSSKTAASVLRYRPDEVVGVLDSANAGQGTTESMLPGLRPVPIFARLAEAMPARPDALLIGIAPVGGALPAAMRQHVTNALRQGLSVISGLHVVLHHDTELAALAEQHNAKIHDVRDASAIQRIGRGLARGTRAKRVLTIGTDCNVGKMATALELRRAAVAAGLDAVFVATGQTGIMIEGWGLAIDHVISDFTAGAVEMLVEHVADRQICFIEGQGSIEHPAYSGVTLSLLHGACPDAMVICHLPGRQLHSEMADCLITPITRQIALYEQILAPVHPGKVVAVSVNTVGLPADEADETIGSIAAQTGLPTADPIRQGCAELLAAVRAQVGL